MRPTVHVHMYISPLPCPSATSVHAECRGFKSHLRQLILLRKSDCLGCAVLLCLVCLFDLACFFLPSFSSLIKHALSCLKSSREQRRQLLQPVRCVAMEMVCVCTSTVSVRHIHIYEAICAQYYFCTHV